MALVCFLVGIAGIILIQTVNVVVGLVLVAAAVLGLGYVMLPGFYASKGSSAFNQNNLPDAVAYYKKAVDTNRAKPGIRAMYANVLLRNGQPEEALEQTDLLLAGTLSTLEKNAVRQTRCLIFSKLGQVEQALAEAEDLFYNENIKSGNTYALIGYLRLLANKDLEETTQFCQEAYEYDDENRDILDNLVCCYYRAGRYDEAKELADKVISMAPRFIEGYYHAAQVAVKQNRIDDALDYLDSIEDCKRTYLTTVSREEIERLGKELGM